LRREPFRPFRVHLSNNTTMDVLTQRGSVIVGPKSAIMPLQYGDTECGHKLVLRWKTVALDEIVEMVDLEGTE